MAGDSAEYVLELLREVLAGYREQYKDCVDGWRHVDTKSQGVIATAGLLLAGTVAIVSNWPDLSGSSQVVVAAVVGEGESRPFGRGAELLLVALMAACLLTCVGFALIALLVRQVTAPPSGQELLGMVEDLEGASGDGVSLSDKQAFTKEQCDLWEQAVKNMLKKHEEKVLALHRAYWALAAAIFAGAVALAVSVWRIS
ncbi:MAG: hypothetical protein ABL907_07960 [Hyphomicrobium sp.]